MIVVWWSILDSSQPTPAVISFVKRKREREEHILPYSSSSSSPLWELNLI